MWRRRLLERGGGRKRKAPTEGDDDQVQSRIVIVGYQLPPGPSDATETFMWAGARIKQLHSHGIRHFGKDLGVSLMDHLGKGVQMSTDYSGPEVQKCPCT